MQTPTTNNINLFLLISKFNFSSSYEKESACGTSLYPRWLQILIRIYIKQKDIFSLELIISLTLGVMWASYDHDMC